MRVKGGGDRQRRGRRKSSISDKQQHASHPSLPAHYYLPPSTFSYATSPLPYCLPAALTPMPASLHASPCTVPYYALLYSPSSLSSLLHPDRAFLRSLDGPSCSIPFHVFSFYLPLPLLPHRQHCCAAFVHETLGTFTCLCLEWDIPPPASCACLYGCLTVYGW